MGAMCTTCASTGKVTSCKAQEKLKGSEASKRKPKNESLIEGIEFFWKQLKQHLYKSGESSTPNTLGYPLYRCLEEARLPSLFMFMLVDFSAEVASDIVPSMTNG